MPRVCGVSMCFVFYGALKIKKYVDGRDKHDHDGRNERNNPDTSVTSTIMTEVLKDVQIGKCVPPPRSRVSRRASRLCNKGRFPDVSTTSL